VGTLPASSRVREILEKLDLLVCQDIFLTETGAMAHILLPAASYAEKEGSFTNHEGYVQKVRKALEPLGDHRPDWEIFSLLAQAMGYPLDYGSVREIKLEVGKIIPDYYKERRSTASLRETMERAVASYVGGGYEEGFAERSSLRKAPGENGFHLVMGQVLFHSGKMSKASDALMQMYPDNALLMNPEDAEQLGVREGETVRLSSAQGEARVRVKFSTKYPTGLLFYPEHLAGGALRDLVSYEVDPVTRVPYYHTGSVTIQREMA
jgi:formate dehydrogenase alpha subunit